MLAYLCDLQNSGGVEEVGPGLHESERLQQVQQGCREVGGGSGITGRPE